MDEGLYQFVPHYRVAEFSAAGWKITDDLADCHHGVYSVLMQAPEDYEDAPRDQ